MKGKKKLLQKSGKWLFWGTRGVGFAFDQRGADRWLLRYWQIFSIQTWVMVFLVSICNYFLVCINGIDGASGKKKNPFANAGDVRGAGLTPRSGRSPGGGYGNPLQYFCLENLMDKGTWQATQGCKEWCVTEAT